LFFRLITDRRLHEKRTKEELLSEVEHHHTMAHHPHHPTPGHPPRGVTGD
jgi:hypothetical protein